MRVPSPRALSFAAATLGSLAAVHSAKAADVGQCFPRQQLADLMVSQGLKSVAVSSLKEELARANLTRTWGWAFSKNPDGTTGYVIRINSAPSEQYTEGCIMEKLHDVTLNDSRASSLPPGTQITFKATPQAMNDVCSKIPGGMHCGYHNEMLNDLYRDDYRIMYQGTDEAGRLVMLLGKNDDDGDGVMTLSDLKKGIMVVVREYINTGYTQYGSDLLRSLSLR